MKHVAIILSGCGYLDGAEIREAVLTLLALDSAQVSYEMFALNKSQCHVVDHLNSAEATDQSRNILVESARIARGVISDLIDLDIENFDGLIIPGGFGVAKNLSSFAFEGSNSVVDPLVTTKVEGFYAAKKPIGAICIAPVIIALVLGKHQPLLTIGNDTDTASELEKLGAKHQDCLTTDCLLDEKNRIVSTPAYMDDSANLADIYAGITKLISRVVQLAK